MFFLKKLLTALALPPTSLLILALFGLWLTRRHPRSGRWLASLALLGLFVLSLPIVSTALLCSLEAQAPVTARQLARAQTIVVLGGGVYHQAPEYGHDTVGRSSLERIRYAAHLQRHHGLPLLVTGGAPFGGRPEGEAMKEAIEQDFGGQVRWVESVSRDTQENARLSAPLLKAAGISRIALVSHAWHLRRAIPLFEQQGFEVIPAPTVFSRDPDHPLALFLPKAKALSDSSMALHEWLGLLVQQL